MLAPCQSNLVGWGPKGDGASAQSRKRYANGRENPPCAKMRYLAGYTSYLTSYSQDGNIRARHSSIPIVPLPRFPCFFRPLFCADDSLCPKKLQDLGFPDAAQETKRRWIGWRGPLPLDIRRCIFFVAFCTFLLHLVLLRNASNKYLTDYQLWGSRPVTRGHKNIEAARIFSSPSSFSDKRDSKKKKKRKKEHRDPPAHITGKGCTTALRKPPI